MGRDAATGTPPSTAGHAATGFGAGLFAGLGVALVDSARLWVVGQNVDWTIPGYAVIPYAAVLGILGAVAGVALALLTAFRRRPPTAPAMTATLIWGWLFALFTLPVGFFYLQRDYFGESAGLFSARMLVAVAILVAAIVVVTVGLGWLARRLLSGQGARLCRLRVAIGAFAAIEALLVIAWLAAGQGAGGEPLKAAPGGKLPNVLLVMNDTHRADHCGAYGGPRDLTPNLDALAAQGVVFKRAYAQASWTRPSVCSILTGRYPSSHTATLKGSVLPDEITTLAEVMLGGGYETIGIATNYNLTPFFNVDQGFHDYRYLAPALPLGATDEQAKLIFIEVARKVTARFHGVEDRPDEYYAIGEVVTDRALARLDRRDAARPFFAFLSYMDVHDPYFRHPFDGYGISHRANPDPDPGDAALIAEMKELYAGEVRYWDGQFGRLIEGLKRRGLYEDTLIVVVSDHGEEFGEHGGFWHGTTLYDEQLEVIFIAKYPRGEHAGQELDAWVRLIDVAPMIISAAGLEVPREMQGAAAPESARTPVFSEEDHQGSVLTSVRFVAEGQESKLIRANENNPRGLAPLELYRTDDDPAERRNLAEADEARLNVAVEALDAAEAAARQGAARAVTDSLSEEQKKVLKQLGYMKEGE